MEPQTLAPDVQQSISRADHSVDPRRYFGVDLDRVQNARTFGLRRGADQELYRVSYLFLLVFGTDDGAEEYGGMQLRAETFVWAEDGAIPTRLQRKVQQTAHRAAHLFDTSIETGAYGPNAWAGGYLRGFDPWENAEQYDNWEVEPVASGEVHHDEPGIIDWTTELYLECDGLKYAQLSGVASGTSNPWTHFTREIEGSEPVHIAPHKWRIGFQESRGDYEIRAPGHSDAADRYRDGAGAGKDVYVNGFKIGGLGPKGRVWLKPEYGVGDGLEYRGNHSRAGLLEKSDDATPQAIRKGGVLYMTGETEESVHLRTSRALPDDYRPSDPDDVPPELTVQDGRPSRTEHFLRLDDRGAPLEVECREDREVIKHLGMSDPPYTHQIEDDGFRWPGFRPVEEYGTIVGRDDRDDRDDGQTGLDGFGGGEP